MRPENTTSRGEGGGEADDGKNMSYLFFCLYYKDVMGAFSICITVDIFSIGQGRKEIKKTRYIMHKVSYRHAYAYVKLKAPS